jgi:glycosyltransferase involved in cell wall biosynthesis
MTAIPKDSIPLVFTEVEAFGGAERSMLALSQWLYQHGRPNHILLYSDKAGLQNYASHPLQVVELKPASGVRNKLKALGQAVSVASPRPILSGYQPALHGTLAGIRGFHTLMHDTPSLFGDVRQRSFKSRLRIGLSNEVIGYGLRSGGATIVTSEYLQAECRKDFRVQAEIARMGGLSTNIQSHIRRVEGELRLLSVCRIEENKRIDWILRALAQLETKTLPLSSLSNWHLDLVGKGSLIPRLSVLAQQLGLADRVTFHGFLPDAEVEELYSRAHLFLMPAVQGYGIPAVEALSRGIPVLLHRESGVSDLLLDTPWATVLQGDESHMSSSLACAIQYAMECRHCSVLPPRIPTEDEWAERVANLCGYPAL